MTKEQFVQRVMETEASLYRVARSILHNEEDCADAAQNAMLKAFRKLDTLKHEKYFETWLTRILINECYRILENRKAEVSYEECMYGMPEASSRESELQQTNHADIAYDEADGESEVFSAIRSLDDKYRIPFVLHYVEGYSVKEISQMLSLGGSNVKVRLSRARAMLRDILEGEAI